MAAEYLWGMYTDGFEMPVNIENETDWRNILVTNEEIHSRQALPSGELRDSGERANRFEESIITILLIKVLKCRRIYLLRTGGGRLTLEEMNELLTYMNRQTSIIPSALRTPSHPGKVVTGRMAS